MSYFIKMNHVMKEKKKLQDVLLDMRTCFYTMDSITRRIFEVDEKKKSKPFWNIGNPCILLYFSGQWLSPLWRNVVYIACIYI